jgi:CheY-like chemotaxis protein
MKYIVVIDAEPTVRKVISNIVGRAGYRVAATGDFEQAIELLRTELPDLVVTNVFLNGITGHDAMLALKNNFPQLPVLMVSGLPDEKTIEDWAKKPGFDVFPKPFLPKDLIQKIDGILGRRGDTA